MTLSRIKFLFEGRKLARVYQQLAVSTLLHKPFIYNFGLDETVMTQYSVKEGMRGFGKDKGEAAVIKELTQLHNTNAIESTPLLTGKQKMESLMYLMYLKEKKGCDIKGQDCADGRKQREILSQGE